MPTKQGALPYQMMREMIAAGYIEGGKTEYIQPSSLDLAITDEVYRLRGSYLPRFGESIREVIRRGSLYEASLKYPLERGGIYLIRLNETLKLPKAIHAAVSNKSSSGRIDLRTRVIADGLSRYDFVPAGYHGSLWLEVTPMSFPVKLYPGDRVNQIRFFYGNAKLNFLEHQFAYDEHHLLRTFAGERLPATDEIVGEGVTMTIDLEGDRTNDMVIGWRSHPGAWNVLDTRKKDHEPLDYFEPIRRPRNGELTLTPGTFYILNTKEKIVVPPDLACQMASYDPSKGEFRSHFAGFFDPGWGWHERDEERGSAAVLEVEAFGHESVIRDGQPICLMVYERMLATPEKLYGKDLNSNYHMQSGPRLAKWFKPLPVEGRRTGERPAATKPPEPHRGVTSLPPVEQKSQPWDNLDAFDFE